MIQQRALNFDSIQSKVKTNLLNFAKKRIKLVFVNLPNNWLGLIIKFPIIRSDKK